MQYLQSLTKTGQNRYVMICLTLQSSKAMSCFKIFKSSAVCSLLSFAKPKALLACDQLRSPHLGHGGSLRTCWDPDVMWSSAFWCAACWSPHKRSATIQSHSNPELASVHDVHLTLGAVWKSVKIRHHGTPKPGESPPFLYIIPLDIPEFPSIWVAIFSSLALAMPGNW